MAQAIKVQRGVTDIGNSGGTDTSFEEVSSLTSAFEINSNNQRNTAGPPSDGGNQEIDDISGTIELTDTTALTFTRQSGSSSNDMRFAWEIIEYLGDPGGPNEFIVRSRNTVTLDGIESTTVDLDNTPTTAAKCIPFITGISSNVTSNGEDHATATAYVTPGGRLFVKRGGVTGITTVQVVTVEFTGSNWQVFHGSANSSNDTGDITITTSGSGVEANGPYEFACLSHSPYYFYYLDSTNLSGENKAGSYDGAANVSGTLVGSGLIDEFDDALEGSAFSITTSNADEINVKSNHAAKTLEAIVRIDDTNTLQCIYEQGGGTRGFSLSIDSGYLYFSGWNNSTSDGPGDDWGANSSRSHVYASVAIPSTGTYYIAGVYVQESSDDTFDGELRVYLGDVTDSTSLTSFINDTDDIGKQYAHSGNALWCENSDGFIGSSGVTTSPSNFDGAINAIALYDVEVTDTQIRSHFDAIFDEDFTPVDTTGVISWDKAFIFGNTIDVSGSEGLAHQAVIYNEGSTTDSSDTKYVNWEFNANHGSTNDHFVHVLCHNDMVVTRFSDTSSAAGANNVSVSSASLSDLEQAMVVGYVTTSGTGDALARGWRNYRFTSLTNVEHWCHRSGNTMRHEIQVIDFSGIEDTATEPTEQYHTKIIAMII